MGILYTPGRFVIQPLFTHLVSKNPDKSELKLAIRPIDEAIVPIFSCVVVALSIVTRRSLFIICN